MADLDSIPWIVAGDFNMIERAQEKSGGLKFEWKGNEPLFWCRMVNTLNLFDTLAGIRHESKGIWLTWSNFQKGDRRIYSRLDRFYLNKMWFICKP